MTALWLFFVVILLYCIADILNEMLKLARLREAREARAEERQRGKLP